MQIRKRSRLTGITHPEHERHHGFKENNDAPSAREATPVNINQPLILSIFHPYALRKKRALETRNPPTKSTSASNVSPKKSNEKPITTIIEPK